MKVINLGQHSSVINNYMAQLRDKGVQQNRALFRSNLRRIARIMAYEVSRTLTYSEKNITTPLGVKAVPTYDDRIVVGTVLRAGLAFHEGFLETFEESDSAFVAAYREEGSKDNIKIHAPYLAAPSIEGCTFIIVDPMLATGGSLELSYKAFLTHGTPSKLHICCVIAAKEGISHLQSIFPSDEVTLWVAAIDDSLNEAAYIVPGLGDAGDLSFGYKL